ncbi:hypothetical protein [Actinophytocola sediminis]
MFRTGFATLLVLLGCLLAGPAVAAFVLAGEVTDEENYLEAVTPLADEPAVQTAVAEQLSASLSDQVPDAARQLVDVSITNFTKSDEFRTSWVEVNREVHPQVLAMLRDEGDGLAIEGDAIVLDLGVVAADLKSRFVADGVPLADRIPEVNARVEVMSSSAIRQAIPTFDIFERLSIVLPIVSIALIALGLLLSARRGQTLIVTGIGLAVVMILVVIAEGLGGGEVVAKSPSPEIATPFYDALTAKLSVVLWVICGIGGVFVIVGAVLSRHASTRAAAAARQPAAPRWG